MVKNFTQSEKSDLEIEYKIPLKSIRLNEFPKDTPPLRLRLKKIIIDDVEVDVLATSLLNKNKFKLETFEDLYFKRWGIEEAFKMLKSRVGLESFSGKTSISVFHDLHAKIFMTTLCSAL